MKVREVMKSPVFSIPENTPYEEAARLMSNNRFSGLTVVNDKGALVGFVSEKDLFKAIYPRYEDFASLPEAYLDQEGRETKIETIRKTPVSEYMTRSVLTIDPDSPVLRAGGIMLAHMIHQLPVVENGALVGIVSRHEIYGAMLQKRLGFGQHAASEWTSRAQNF